MAERITIIIDTDNAAFDESPASEIARILKNLAKTFERQGLPPSNLKDENGNTCGSCSITHKPD